jgi:predicted nucleotidyltransferase component of viral defense system
MIPMMNIIAWSQTAPWAEIRQVEQDLIISRAVVEIFSDLILPNQLRFRGGTALNKLHFSTPLRYSEEIDLDRTEAGPIGSVLDCNRDVLEPWLGRASFDQSPVAPKLRFRVAAEDPAATAQIHLKLEINTAETRERMMLLITCRFGSTAAAPSYQD